MTAHLTQDEAELVARLKADNDWLMSSRLPGHELRALEAGNNALRSIAAISRMAEEREESRVGYARLMNRISEIREASGLGAKPMLDELPGAIKQIAGDLAYAKQALDRETARALRFGRELTTAEAALSQMKEALKPFAEYCDELNGFLDNHNQPIPDDQGPGWVYVTIGDFRAASRALAQQPGKEGI